MISGAFPVAFAVLAALAVGVAPGLFWARLLVFTRDLYVCLAFSTALSFALVPTFAVLLAKTLDSGVTIGVAVAAPSLVFASGLVASRVFGRSKNGKHAGDAPVSEPPGPVSGYALAALAPALAMASLAFTGVLPAASTMLPVAILVVFAGAAQAVATRRTADGEETSRPPGGASPGEERRARSFLAGFGGVRRALLPVVLALVLCRYYLGVVLHDWPYLRGGDLYSHAVMANQMMEEGEILPYLVYPPGFHTMTAILARLTNLDPLEIFPVLVPALMSLPPLALYALAAKLWGRSYGVAAAAVSGLALASTHDYFDVAMYPNVTSSQFLLPMAVAALILAYSRPGVRAAVLVAILGAAIVFYHPVGSLYAAALFGAVGVIFVPYLLLRRRKEGVALLGGFAMLGLLAVAYAWGTYDLPGIVGGFLGGSGTGSGGYAVASAVGTQGTLPPENLLDSVTTPVLWLGLFGAFVILFAKHDGTADFLSRYTLLFWAAILFIGSRTALSGFPVRFERDLGIPLALLAAFALGALVKSVVGVRVGGRSTFAVAVVAVSLAIFLFGAQVFRNFERATEEASIFLMTPEISEAGEWLRENNEGGNIIVGPHQNQVPSRAMLAMGDYSALQSFTPSRIVFDRDLPPHGPEPMWDVLRAVSDPGGERTARILDEYDVRYVVFYKRFDPNTTWGSEVPPDWWRGFEANPELYEKAFENEGVVIFEPEDEAQTS